VYFFITRFGMHGFILKVGPVLLFHPLERVNSSTSRYNICYEVQQHVAPNMFTTSMANVNTLLQRVIVQRRRMSRYAVDDDMSDSSESNSSSDESSMSDIDDNFDTMNVIVRPAIQQVLVYGSFIYGKIEDESINFNQRRTIQDFTCSECVNDFRFRKEHLQDLSHKLWPRLSPFLGDNRDHLILQNRYTAPFETCLLVYLFKMARPVRLKPDCGRKFGMRKTHLSVIVNFFVNALFSLSQQYLFNPDIWHHRMTYYGKLVALKCGHISPTYGALLMERSVVHAVQF
jgi:hypothetical protein